MGTKGPFASLKQKLIKNGLFLQSVRQDGSEMIQISHARHVNVQEHPGVNSLAAQAELLPRASCWGQGPGTVAVLPVPSPAPHSQGCPGQGRGSTWAGTSPELCEPMLPAWHHLLSPPRPFVTGHKEIPALPGSAGILPRALQQFLL